jgi:tetratricopeptide (TPR) repeat protein
MSDNDAFDRALQALRETGETSADEVARTRRRVLDTLHRGERRGRRTFWVLLPIAAVLAGGAAFAKNSDVVQRVWTGVVETVGIRAPAAPSVPHEPPMRAEGAGSSSAEEPVNDSIPDVPRVEPAETAAPSESAPHAPAPRRVRRPAVAEQTPEPAPSATPEVVETEAPGTSAAANDAEAASLQLYKNAYRLHFGEQRYAAALAAWDEYLRAAPAGRLVVEARYNRAIALVRLGRRSEAETALAPFARGEVSGGYRAREARELLDALNGSGR